MEENNQENPVVDTQEPEYPPLNELLAYLNEEDLKTDGSPEGTQTKLYEVTDRYNNLVFRSSEALQNADPATEQVSPSEEEIENRVAELVEARNNDLAAQYQAMTKQLEDTYADREREIVDGYTNRDAEVSAYITQLEEELAQARETPAADQPLSSAHARINRIVEETAEASESYLNELVTKAATVVAEAEEEAANIRAEAEADAAQKIADADAHATKLVADATEEANAAIAHRNEAIRGAKDIFDRFGGLFAHQQREFTRHGQTFSETPLLSLEAGETRNEVEAGSVTEPAEEDQVEVPVTDENADQVEEQDEAVETEEAPAEVVEDNQDEDSDPSDAEEEGWPVVYADSSPAPEEGQETDQEDNQQS